MLLKEHIIKYNISKKKRTYVAPLPDNPDDGIIVVGYENNKLACDVLTKIVEGEDIDYKEYRYIVDIKNGKVLSKKELAD